MVELNEKNKDSISNGVNLIVIGTNHKYSPIELREKISFSKHRLKDALSLLRETNTLKGAVILSTCNRVEIYASTDNIDISRREIENFISFYHEVNRSRFSPYLYIYEDKQALEHLFSVTSGLDSLILGETQILGQVKAAFFEADSIGFVDKFLRDIFISSITFAKKIHSHTKISEGKSSIGSVAIDFLKERFDSLCGKKILIIGVGKVTELVLQYLKKENSRVIFISNRTFDKASRLANQIGAKAVKFDELEQFLKQADIVITATASPHFIIKKETLEQNVNHEIIIVDLALPRDVDPQVKEIKNVELFCLEDFDSVIKKNIQKKTQQAKIANELVQKETERLWTRLIALRLRSGLMVSEATIGG